MRYFLILLFLLGGVQTSLGQQQIAFISDAHIQNVTDHPELVRSMEVQVQSTRLFNENYFALIAALDDVARREISLVVLPGDLTDNGQPVNMAKIQELLAAYSDRYGIQFFVTSGNHDPVRPYGMESVGHDFLQTDGSRATLREYCAGYPELMSYYEKFGFSPQAEYVYWETPFTSYGYEDYTFHKAVAEGTLEHRHYTLCDTLQAIDASYLVEPVEGVWLLAIDGGVYLPDKVADGKQLYKGSSVGYNNLLQYKPFLLPWVKKIAGEAEKRGKTLVAFSHYPLVDFNDGASELVRKAWGENKFDLHRVPSEEVGKAFLEAGIRLHVAGHMHVNDTGVLQGKDGKCLYNIQVPSIATYIPAYKILSLEGKDKFRVKTVQLDSVAEFDSLFELYRKEYAHDVRAGKKPLWSKEALESKTYQEFCDWQFRDLVRVRFIPKDLPAVVRDSIVPASGEQLWKRVTGTVAPDKSYKNWSGYDLILDLYRLRYADKLALRHISQQRLEAYRCLFDEAEKQASSSEIVTRLNELAGMFDCFLSGEPCDSFLIDLQKDRLSE